VVTGPAGFEEDCARAAIVASALNAPADCKAQVFDQQVFDRRRLALTGAVGLRWDGSRFLVATDRSILEDRPWSPAPQREPDGGIMLPQSGETPGADPADP
jgi:competence protein ComEC